MASIMLTAMPFAGHARPIRAVAGELVRRGHDVRVYTGRSYVATFEDVGALLASSPPSLYMFSSDYPHAEGGRDPISRFDRSLADLPQPSVDAFYAVNAAEWLSLT